MQIDPNILKESPDLAEVQKNFSDINSQNVVPTVPESPLNPVPPSEDPLDALIRKSSSLPKAPSFSVQVSDLPNSDRYPFILSNTNYEEIYAQSQGTASKWGNALVKMAGLATTTFLQGTFGTINGVFKSIQDGKLSSFYDNDMTRELDAFNQGLENTLPNYYTEAEKNADWYSPNNLLTANFWADKVVKNLGFAAGAVGSGVAWTKALQAARLFSNAASIGKMAQASSALEDAISTVPQIEKLSAGTSALEAVAQQFNVGRTAIDRTQRIISAGLASTSEAAIESLQGLNNFRTARINEYINQYGTRPTGEDLDNINDESEKVGNWTFGLNVALLTASNYIQFPKILGSDYPIEKATLNSGIKDIENVVFDQATNKFIKRAPSTRIGKILSSTKNVASYFFAPEEAAEEATQFAIGVGTEDYFSKKYRGEQVDFFSSLGEGVKQTLTTKEGIESILIGGLSGGISQNVSPTNFLGRIREQREINANTDQAVAAFNNSTFNGYMKDSIDSFNRSLTLQEQRANAIKNSQRFDAGDLEVDYLHNYLQPRIKYGRFDLVTEDIQKYMQLALSPQGLQEIKTQFGEDITSTGFVQKLNNIQEYATSMKEMYKNLNMRYSGQVNEQGARVYSDEVIDKMVYASCKVISYDKMLPEMINPLLLAGVNPQPIFDSIANSGRPSESTVKDAINQINNLDVITDVKEDLREQLRDTVEATLRRRKFLKDYENLKKNPNRYTNPVVGASDFIGRSKFLVPQQEGEVEVDIATSYGINENFRREGNRITVFPTIGVLGETSLGELNVRFPNGETAIVAAEDLQDYNIATEPNENQEELTRRFEAAVDQITSKEEYQDLNIPQGDIFAALQAINNLDNQALVDEIEQAINDAQNQFNQEQEQLEELRRNKERLKEIEKEFEEDEETSGVYTAPPGPDNTVTTKVNAFNSKRKPLSELFTSTTAPNYEISTPHDNYHRRTNKFLNDIDTIQDRDQIQVLLVTVSNQDSLGLSGLIPEIIPDGSKTPNTDPDKGTIVAVFVKGDEFIGVDGQSIGKISESVDLNKVIYQTLPDDSLTFRNKENRYIDEGSKAASEELAEEAQKDWREKRTEIMDYPDPLRYNFNVSRGIPNNPEGTPPTSPVGVLITEQDLYEPIITILTNEVRKSGSIRLGEIEHNGRTLYFPLGRPLLNKGSVLYQLNNRKFTEEEQTNLQTVLANLPSQGGVNEEILSYLQGILYISRPKGNPAANQMWFEDGYLYLGSTENRVPFVKESIQSAPEVTNFLSKVNFNVSVTLKNANKSFTEIQSINEDGIFKTKEWPSYNHFLLSPEDGRNSPLYVNLVNPANSEDPNAAPFLQKYVILEDFEVPEQASEVSDEPTVAPTEEEIDEYEDFTSDTLMDEGGDIFLQIGDPSPAADDTLLKLNAFLSSVGVSVETVPQIVVDGRPIAASGLANPLNKLIQVVQGQENVALPEEAMHIAVELIERQDPTLFNRMLNRIEQYTIYKEVLNTYKNNPFYQTNGKPDIRKLKKEAMGKVLAEAAIHKNEGSTEKPNLLEQSASWWQQILNFFRDLFQGNPFEKTVGQVLNDQLVSAELPSQESVFLQLSPDQRTEFASIADKAETITKEGAEFKIGETKIETTVADVVDDVYDRLYRNGTISEQEYKEYSQQEKDFKDDKGHREFSEMMNRLLDGDGFLRPEELPKGDYTFSKSSYDALYDNLKDRLITYPANTRFLFNVNIYDESKDLAGNVDLLALNPDGKIDILDFRFLELPEDTETLPSPIRQAAQKAVETYQSILTSAYGIPTSSFGRRRTIPIITTEGGLQIGSVREREENLILQPIVSRTESTGNKQVDDYLIELNNLIDNQLQVASEKGQEYVKYGRIKDILASIRNIQLYNSGTKLTTTASKDIAQMNKYFARYFKILKSGDPDQIKTLNTEDLSSQLTKSLQVLDLYSRITRLYESDFSGTPALGGNKNKAEKVVGEATATRDRLIDLSKHLRVDVVARGVGIQDTLKPEKSIGNWAGWMRSLSQSPTKAGQILWRIVDKATSAASVEYWQEYEKLKSLATKFSDYAKSKGTTVDAQFKRLLGFEGKSWTGGLFSKISNDYYADLSKAIENKDINWIRENIDQDAYRKWYDAELQTREDNQIETKYDEDESRDAEQKEKAMERFKKQFDVFSDEFTPSKSNYKLMEFPLESKWLSKEYRDIENEKPLLDFYNYWQERNAESYRLGMIKSWQAKTFIANVRKTLTDDLTFGTENRGNKSTNLSVLNSIRVDVNDAAFGNMDKVTGENRDRLFAMYTYDLGEKAVDSDGKAFRDYAGKSADLFKVLSLWNQEMAKFKYYSQVENTINLLHVTEVNRSSVAKDKRTGGILFKKGKNEPEVIQSNIENSQYLKDYIDYYLYGRKLKLGSDVTFKFKYNSLANAVNKVVNIMPVSAEDDITISGRKMLQQANRWFSLKVLGINLASAGSNLFGGTANAFIQSGKFMTSADIRNGQLRLASAKFATEEGKKYAGLINNFSTLLTDVANDTSRSLSVNWATRWLNSDSIMYLQRGSDFLVQAPVAMAFFDNTMVENGELVNIREFVKNKNNYDSIFDLPLAQRNEVLAKIEKEIEALKNERSLPKVVQVVDDKLVIPGVEWQSNSVYNLRSRIQQYTKDIIGNMSPEDTARYRMTILGQSFMMFKNWIPRMFDVRFSEMRFNVGTDAYEWGRMRMLANAVKHNWRNAALDVIATLGNSNEGLIKIAKQAYQDKKNQQLELEGTFNMGEAEFIEAYVRGIKGSLQELIGWGILAGMLFAAKAYAPDDDDENVKGIHKWAVRYIDKINGELGFFYNPMSYLQLAEGNIFPAIGVAQDVINLTSATSAELWYGMGALSDVDGSEEALEKNKVARYVWKAFPIGKELITYAAMFNDELARDMGVKVPLQVRK